MALWLVRNGKHGEHESRFFDTNRIYLTWEGSASHSRQAPNHQDTDRFRQHR